MVESFILVAIPSDSVRSLAEYLRANIQQKYQLYGTVTPPFHFAVELIRPTNSEEMRQAIQTIQSITATFPPFDLTVRGYHFFDPPYLAITLAVERSRVIWCARKAKAQKLSFGAVKGVCANQIFVKTKVKCERETDNFCLLRERK
jgi:hypothetical protein